MMNESNITLNVSIILIRSKLGIRRMLSTGKTLGKPINQKRKSTRRKRAMRK
jgi:hypothetical protein